MQKKSVRFSSALLELHWKSTDLVWHKICNWVCCRYFDHNDTIWFSYSHKRYTDILTAYKKTAVRKPVILGFFVFYTDIVKRYTFLCSILLALREKFEEIVKKCIL